MHRIRRNRFVFTVEKDVILLKKALQFNPWQEGYDNWKEVVKELQTLGWKVTERSIKNHIILLRDQYKKQLLVVKSGMEEIANERSELMKDIDTIMTQSEIPIIEEAIDDTKTDSGHTREKSTGRQGRQHFRCRTKRGKLTFEEEVIKQKQEHEIAMECKKMIILEEETLHKIKREQNQLELDKRRLDFEVQRDATQAQFLEMQGKMLDLMTLVFQNQQI